MNPRRAGLSLIEVMIAITILGFALLPLFLYMRTGTRVVAGTRDIATATLLASEALEALRAWPYERLAEEDLAGGRPGPSAEARFAEPEQAEVLVGRQRFRRQVEVTPLAQQDGDPDVKLVRIRVEWDRRGTPLAYELSSVIADG